MTAGPGIDDYDAPYWVNRGLARFYRYVKNDPCAGCASVSDPAGVQVDVRNRLPG